MTAALGVWWARELVGRLRRDGDRLAFAYDRGWLDRGRAISVSLPLREEEWLGGAAEAFFVNLLPEGGMREAVARRFGVSQANDFALLAAIGGECAGALTLAALEPPPSGDPEYELLGRARLGRLIDSDDALALVVGGPRSRLSLAGAQHKLPVFVDGGELYLPLHDAPSSHILKLPHSRLRHVLANEWLMNRFAAALGIPVVDCELRLEAKEPLLLVRRFDRALGDSGDFVRIHQEDFCQALGVPPSRKYEQEGGPSLAAAIELVRAEARNPLKDTRELLRWAAFNWLAGNADGHAKNLALVHRGGPPELAPFYDLVCTRIYKNLDPKLAMSVGGEADPGRIGHARWTALARAIGVGPRVVADELRHLLDAADEALAATARDFRERHGAHPLLQLVPRQIKKQLRYARELVRVTG